VSGIRLTPAGSSCEELCLNSATADRGFWTPAPAAAADASELTLPAEVLPRACAEAAPLLLALAAGLLPLPPSAGLLPINPLLLLPLVSFMLALLDAGNAVLPGPLVRDLMPAAGIVCMPDLLCGRRPCCPAVARAGAVPSSVAFAC